MTEKKQPRWKDPRHIARSSKYSTETGFRINIHLNKNTDADLIEIYQSIPNKRAWFKQALLDYAKQND